MIDKVKPIWRGLLGATCMLSLCSAPPALADSTPAQCGFADAVDVPPAATFACTFSQRQGNVTIYADDGIEFDFRPVGDMPGNYQDAEGNAVYRRSGLGEDGQIFQLPDRVLFVYWIRDKFACTGDEIASPAGCVLNYFGLVFALDAGDRSSINRLTLTASGLENGPQQFERELDGTALGAEVADLDANGWPEIYVYVSSAGSGSYGSLMAYAVNNGKSLSPVYLPPVTDNPQARTGYMGHDEFAIVENRLVQRFPVYRDGDSNINPTGGMRQLQYRLSAGEAGWKLVVDRIVEY